MDDARMYIGRFAQQAGTTAKTVRYYEEPGLLAGAARSETGYRLYGAADLERLRFVLGAKALGLTLIARPRRPTCPAPTWRARPAAAGTPASLRRPSRCSRGAEPAASAHAAIWLGGTAGDADVPGVGTALQAGQAST
jgi:hypothetical protein